MSERVATPLPRQRTYHGTSYFESDHTFQDLAVAVRRFPSPPDVDDSTVFVLVHGIGVSSRYFRPVAVELAKRGTVYLIDLPGYGSAPNPRTTVTIADHAHVLGDFLTDFGLTNPVIVGHSMGTQVVSALAVESPQITDRIVLMAPTVNKAERSLPMMMLRLGQDTLREPPRVNAIVATDYLIRCGVPYFIKQLPQLLGDRMEDRLPEIVARTLVLRGDRDPIVSRAWAEYVTALIPDADLHDVIGPHVVMYTDPIRVAALIHAHAER